MEQVRQVEDGGKEIKEANGVQEDGNITISAEATVEGDVAQAIVVTERASQPELTDKMLWKFSQHITSESDIYNIAIKGLSRESHIVEAALTNNRFNITLAAYKILGKWSQSVSSSRVAYDILCNAVSKVEMARLRNVLTD